MHLRLILKEFFGSTRDFLDLFYLCPSPLFIFVLIQKPVLNILQWPSLTTQQVAQKQATWKRKHVKTTNLCTIREHLSILSQDSIFSCVINSIDLACRLLPLFGWPFEFSSWYQAIIITYYELCKANTPFGDHWQMTLFQNSREYFGSNTGVHKIMVGWPGSTLRNNDLRKTKGEIEVLQRGAPNS